MFKDDYKGLIVVSNRKIATDTNDTDKEWIAIIQCDKDGITIQDSLPEKFYTVAKATMDCSF